MLDQCMFNKVTVKFRIQKRIKNITVYRVICWFPDYYVTCREIAALINENVFQAIVHWK